MSDDLSITVTASDSALAEAASAWPAATCLAPDETDIKLVLHATLPRCPFCNGTPTTFARYFEHSGIYQSYVNCSWCPAQVFVNSRDREDARQQAIAAWSKRAITATTHLAGIKLALEAAAREADAWFPGDSKQRYPASGVAAAIRALDPEAIAKEGDCG